MAPLRADRRFPDRQLSAIETIRRYVARRNATTLRFARAITANEDSSSLLDWREVFTTVTAEIRRREVSDRPVLANAVVEQIQAVGQRVREVARGGGRDPPVNQLVAVHQATYAVAQADRTQPGRYDRDIFMRLSNAIFDVKDKLIDEEYIELNEALQHARNMWTATHEAVYECAYDHAVGNPAATRQAAFDAAVDNLPDDDDDEDSGSDEGEGEGEGEGGGESANWPFLDNPDDDEVVYRGDVRALRETVPPAVPPSMDEANITALCCAEESGDIVTGDEVGRVCIWSN